MQKREALTSSGFNCSAFSDEAFALNLRFKQLCHRRLGPDASSSLSSSLIPQAGCGASACFQRGRSRVSEEGWRAGPSRLTSRYLFPLLSLLSSLHSLWSSRSVPTGGWVPVPLPPGRKVLFRSPEPVRWRGGGGGRLGCLGALKMGEGGQEGGATR